MSDETGNYAYACPMPPQGTAPQPIFIPSAPLVVPAQPPLPAEWAGPSIEDDLREAERLFGCALSRIRAAIAKHRAQEGTR